MEELLWNGNLISVNTTQFRLLSEKYARIPRDLASNIEDNLTETERRVVIAMPGKEGKRELLLKG